MGNSEVKESHYYPVQNALIVSHKNVENNKYTLYVIQVTTEVGKWIVQRRYAEFHKFYDELSNHFPNIAIPKLPEKKIWGNMDPGFIHERKKGLNTFLTSIFQIANQQLLTCQELLMFFDAFNPTFIERFDDPQTQQQIRSSSRSNSVSSVGVGSVSSFSTSLPAPGYLSQSLNGDSVMGSVSIPEPSVFNHPSMYFHGQSRTELEYTTLYSWLESINMASHIQSFINNGFTLDILKYYGITEFHLNNMQIMDPHHRSVILSEVAKLRQETFASLGLTQSVSSTATKESEDESKLCVICFEGFKEALLAPCGHICCCMDCATGLEDKKAACPVCRKTITSVYKAFVV